MYKILFFTITFMIILSKLTYAYDIDSINIKSYLPNEKHGLVQDKDVIAKIIVENFIPDAYEGRLNSPDCDENPQYYCNGIMLSGFENDDMYWTKSNPPFNKFSMTYFQKATTLKTQSPIFINTESGVAGYMLWPQSLLNQIVETNTAFIPNYRCIYPIDAGSDYRSDNGCGVFKPEDIVNQPCQNIGVYDAQEWLKKYTPLTIFTTCSFTLDGSVKDRTSFDVVKQVQITLNDQKESVLGMQWDEVILKPWASDEPARIPLMAFFYVTPGPLTVKAKENIITKNKFQSDPVDILEYAKKQQLNYYKMTQIFAPIVRISGINWDNIKFEYYPEEQASEIPKSVHMFPQ